MNLKELAHRRRPLEKETQAAIVKLFRSVGGIVYSTSQGYRKERGGTRMTPGISDLLVFFPHIYVGEPDRDFAHLLFFEVKRDGEERTIDQERFGDYATLSPADYEWGGLETAKAYLKRRGLIS